MAMKDLEQLLYYLGFVNNNTSVVLELHFTFKDLVYFESYLGSFTPQPLAANDIFKV